MVTDIVTKHLTYIMGFCQHPAVSRLRTNFQPLQIYRYVFTNIITNTEDKQTMAKFEHSVSQKS